MRSDLVPLSASALVIGVMSLVFGSVLNPAETGVLTADIAKVVSTDSARWLAMAVMYLFASVSLTLGIPAVLTLFEHRGRRLGLVGLTLFAVGAVGTCGYALMVVSVRALAGAETVTVETLGRVGRDPALRFLVGGWVAAFYAGVLVLAVALLVSGSTARWVPGVMIAFVALVPLAGHVSRVLNAAQVMALAVALTGIAMAAVADDQRRTRDTMAV